jgi:hypothetical protein
MELHPPSEQHGDAQHAEYNQHLRYFGRDSTRFWPPALLALWCASILSYGLSTAAVLFWFSTLLLIQLVLLHGRRWRLDHRAWPVACAFLDSFHGDEPIGDGVGLGGGPSPLPF